MFTDSVAIQSPQNQGAILDAITGAARAVGSGSLKAGYAYTSVGGVQLMSWSLNEFAEGWAKMKKQWLVSFDWGITDPDAVELLALLPNSQVRIPRAEQVLARRLIPAVCFHPKTLALHGGRAPGKHQSRW